ncbi:acetyltransferase [bacterium]|nr:acetyltransferase [bacterium]
MSTHAVLSIMGASGHGRVIADAAQLSGRWAKVMFYDDAEPGPDSMAEWPVAGNVSDLISMSPSANHQVIVGIGDNTMRLTHHKKFKALGWTMATVVHPSATISPHANVCSGSIVMAGVVINVGAFVDEACIVNTCASIDHDCHLGQGVHISPGAVLAGTVMVGSRAWIGAGSVVINNINIGDDAILGAGSTAIRDIASDSVAVGSPASVIKSNK